MNLSHEAQTNERVDPKPLDTKLPLIASIVSIVFCCNFLFGSVGLVMAIQAANAESSGDLETARSTAVRSLKIVLLGVGLSAVLAIYQGVHFLLSR